MHGDGRNTGPRIKLGGSSWIGPSGERFRRWLARQPAIGSVLVCGGGRRADDVRRWDELFDLGAEIAHDMAIAAMSENTADVCRLLAEPRGMAAGKSCPSGGAARVSGVRAGRFFDAAGAGRGQRPIPHSWDVTSDSLAAQLAHVLRAKELVLLKSALPPSQQRRSPGGRGGYVDRCFPEFAPACR